jgi:hypothetical protein
MIRFTALLACLLLALSGAAVADQTTQGLSINTSIFFEGVSQDLGGAGKDSLDYNYLNGRGRFGFTYAKGDYQGVLKFEIGEFLGKPALGTTTARDGRIIEVKNLYVAGPVPFTPLGFSFGLQDITLGNGLVMSEDYVSLNFTYKDLGVAFVSLAETLYSDVDVSAVAVFYSGTFGAVTVKPYLIYGRYADGYDAVGTADSGDGDLIWVGVPVSFAAGALRVDAEFDYLSGSKSDYVEAAAIFRDVDYDSYALWAKANLDLGKTQVYAMAGYGTGDKDPTDDENTAFTPIDEDMTIDIVWEDNLGGGLSNLLFARVGADFAATDALTLGAAVVFERFAEGAKKGIGTELNFTAAYTISESTVLTAGLGYLFAGDAFDDDRYLAYWNLEFNY